MKTIITTALLFLFILTGLAQTEEAPKPEILNSPENWKFERIDFPLGFAPDIQFKGFEELRFAPGMFDVDAADYFTYFIAMSIENKTHFDSDEIESMLNSYYKGLAMAVAGDKPVDESKVTAKITAQLNEFNRNFYSAKVTFIDHFTDGREVDLFMEIEEIKSKKQNVIYLIAIVSPVNPHDSYWKELRKTRDSLAEKMQ